jgi:hypothetical protein
MATINFPKPPQRPSYGGMTFPSDLITGDRNRYCSLDLVSYEIGLQFSSTALIRGGGAIRLPMPKTITESLSQQWQQESLGPQFWDALSQSKAGGAAGITAGLALNPFLFFKYKNPDYKTYSLEWTLAAVNQKESDTIKSICDMLKRGSLPGVGGDGLLFSYPDVLLISFTPDDYLFSFRPAVIHNVTVNYSAAGQQAFFKSGAPVIVELKLDISEISWWTKDNADF